MGGFVKPAKEEIQSFYSQALERCVGAFSTLSDKEWAKKVSDQWTARDHLAYLVGMTEEETLPLTRQALAGEQPNIPDFEKRSDLPEFRNRVMAGLEGIEAPDLLKRLQAAVGEHMSILDGLSEADLDKPAMSPAWDRPGTVRDLYFAGYLFLPGQYQEIRKANKKKLPHWIESGTPEQVRYHLDRTFHYMPLIYRSSVGGDMAATYLFTMEGDNGGQWSIRIENGRAESQDGPPDGFDAEVRTKPELWMDLATGDLNPIWAVTTRKLHLGGNAGLAMKLSSLFSAEE
jgi:putative sterol carrier protein